MVTVGTLERIHLNSYGEVLTGCSPMAPHPPINTSAESDEVSSHGSQRFALTASHVICTRGVSHTMCWVCTRGLCIEQGHAHVEYPLRHGTGHIHAVVQGYAHAGCMAQSHAHAGYMAQSHAHAAVTHTIWHRGTHKRVSQEGHAQAMFHKGICGGLGHPRYPRRACTSDASWMIPGRPDGWPHRYSPCVAASWTFSEVRCT